MPPLLRQDADFLLQSAYLTIRSAVVMPKITLTRWPANAGQITINKIRARL